MLSQMSGTMAFHVFNFVRARWLTKTHTMNKVNPAKGGYIPNHKIFCREPPPAGVQHPDGDPGAGQVLLRAPPPRGERQEEHPRKVRRPLLVLLLPRARPLPHLRLRAPLRTLPLLRMRSHRSAGNTRVGTVNRRLHKQTEKVLQNLKKKKKLIFWKKLCNVFLSVDIPWYPLQLPSNSSQLLVNWIVAQWVCFRRNYYVRNISTAVASLIAPICIVSKHTVEGYYDPEQRFRRFYRYP